MPANISRWRKVKQQIQATDNSLLDCFRLIPFLLLQPLFNVLHLPSIFVFHLSNFGIFVTTQWKGGLIPATSVAPWGAGS